MMETNEILDVLREKNHLLTRQSKRIELLEEKMYQLRKKYFHLKNAGANNRLKPAILMSSLMSAMISSSNGMNPRVLSLEEAYYFLRGKENEPTVSIPSELHAKGDLNHLPL